MQAQILEAARRCFSRNGYQGASMRSIAKEAGVDAKLIHYYFGAKADLFAAVIHNVFENEGLRERLQNGFSTHNDGLRDYIEHVFLALDDPDIGPAFISLLRSLGTHADSRQIFNLFIHNQVLKLPGMRLPNGEVALEVNAVGAQIIGLIFFRYILEVPHVAAATPAELAASVAPAIGTYLTVVVERGEQSSAY